MARFFISNIQEPYYQNRDYLYSPIKGKKYKHSLEIIHIKLFIILPLTAAVYFPPI